MQHRLSKSKLLSGLQCQKRLYLETHHPEYAKKNVAASGRMKTGNQVGDIARQLIPGGIFLDDSYTLREALTKQHTC